MKKPKPIVTEQVCDICGEDWAKHPENPTVLDCVELLHDHIASLALKVARQPQWQSYQSVIPPYRIDCASGTTTATLNGGLTIGGNVTPIAFKRDDDDGAAGVRVPA